MNNSMLDILKGFDNAGRKTLTESTVEECGMDAGMAAPQMAAPQGGEISIKLDDTAQMAKLLMAMQAVTSGSVNDVQDAPMMTATPMDDPQEPGRDGVPGDADMDDGVAGALAGAALGAKAGGIPGAVAGGFLGHKTQQAADKDPEMEDYENEPEEEYSDVDTVLPSGDDMHRKKDPRAIRVKDPAVETSIKDRLWAALNEKKVSNCSDCGKPSYTTLDEEKQKGVDGKVCWKGYKRMGTKKKGGKTVDNCVKM